MFACCGIHSILLLGHHSVSSGAAEIVGIAAETSSLRKTNREFPPTPAPTQKEKKKSHPYCQGKELTANKATCAGSHADKDGDAGAESEPHPPPQPVLVQTEIASRQFCCQLEILSLLVD